ncbi:MAG: 6,7-dimethyl-8-ribityllumazine synthase [Candidatus Caenarcaniphilales bacterium]|nr:6,7-dimethyl-8-ribityllumazine synthase [Candidatus Caenarcaniphilales bacterium]
MSSSYKVISANLDAKDLRVAIVISRWHDFINEKLLAGAVDTIVRHGGSESNIEVVYVPGSFEIPLMTKKMAETKKYNVIIAIGTVIRGQTLHFDLIAAEAVKGISQVGMDTGVPISLGILTTDTIEQSLERAGSKQGNKGSEAALAAIEMANLLKEFKI